MTTESPVRITGETGIRSWPTTGEALASSSGVSTTSQELGLLFPKSTGYQKNHVPNRSGSAPPSIDGSCAMLNNDTGQRHPSPVGGLVRSSKDEARIYEEKLRSHPSYVAFYVSNVNLNPRLPPPISSRETRHLAQRVNHSVETWRPGADDDGSTGHFLSARTSLPAHAEDPEDVQLIGQDLSGNSDRLLSGQFVYSLEGHHSSATDLTQGLSRTPSPMYDNSTLVPSPCTRENRANSDACANTLRAVSAATTKNPKLDPCACVSTPGLCNDERIRSNISARRQLCLKANTHHIGPKEGTDNTSFVDANQDTISTSLRGLHISSEKEVQHLRQNLQPNMLLHQDSASQLHVLQSQGLGPTYNIINQFPQGQLKLPPADKKTVLQNTAAAGLLFSAPGYLTSGSPTYSNMPSMFAPHLNIGGYALNTSPFSPFIAGYPPPGVLPMTFESPQTLGINGTEGIFAAGLDLQNLYKYPGPVGVVLQPPFSDSQCVPYFLPPPVSAYGASVHYDPTSRGHDLQKGPTSHPPDQRQMHLRDGSLDIPTPIKIGVPNAVHYANPTNVGVLLQYPASPLASPHLPGSSLTQASLPIRRPDNTKLSVCPIKNSGTYYSWQVPREREKLGDVKGYSILEEVKSNKSRRFELTDVVGHVIEFSTDQHGSRFIQQKLETCCPEEKASVFSEVLPRAAMLMTDVFGNYVIQKFFEYGNLEQRKELANQLVGRVLPLSLQMYGCRVIQKALEVVEVDQKTELVLELDGHVMRCVRDQNGNHVIQKCIECVPTNRILFIISAFHDQVAALSMHPYGCRVIQRVLEHCTDEAQIQCILNEILRSACLLAQDQYGNYVIQHVLEKGRPHERSQIISTFSGQVVRMSQHKFASNVIEKCLKYGDAAERECIIEEIVGETEGNDMLLLMMKDQFANYVVQKILETCNENQREILLNRIRVHLQALKRYTYGKHIVARVEQLIGEGCASSE